MSDEVMMVLIRAVIGVSTGESEPMIGEYEQTFIGEYEHFSANTNNYRRVRTIIGEYELKQFTISFLPDTHGALLTFKIEDHPD